LEHLFFGGTKKRPHTKEISAAIESVGGEFNAYTGEDKTCFYTKVPAAYLETGFEVLADMLTNSLFDPAKIDRERGVVIEEINLYNDDPGKQIIEILPEVLWPDQPLGMTVIGPKEVIASISRDEILDYVQRRYRPSNMVVSVAGKVDPSAVQELARALLGGEEKGAVSSAKQAVNVPGSRVKALKRDIDQTHFMVAAYAPALKSEDRFATRIMNAILGEGMSSRLFQNVREERGLAYSIRSSYEGLIDTGVVSVKAGVNSGKTEQAITATFAELSRIAEDRVDSEELERAREYVKGGLQLRLEDPASLADWLGSQMILLGEVQGPEEWLAHYDDVTAEQVQRVAQEIFQPDNRHLLVIGPEAEEPKLKKLLAK
jgi:predicted Zn-dependent peptidase